MPRLRLTKPGYENFTGPLLGVKFTAGVSGDIPLATIDTIAASIAGNIVGADGTTVISAAGKLQRELAQTGRVRDVPARPIGGGGVAPRASRMNNLVALIGHSKNRQAINQTYSGVANRSVILGLQAFHASALSRGQVIFPESCAFAVGGTTSYDLINTKLTAATAPSGFGIGKTQVEAARDCAASSVVIFAEHNDRFAGMSLAQSISNHLTAVQALVAAGKIVIVSTDAPTGNANDATRRLTGTQLAYHTAFRDWVLNTLPGLFPGAAFGADCWQGTQDLAPTATAGDIMPAAAVDTVHLSMFGSYPLGKAIPEILAPFLPKGQPRIGVRGEVYDAVNNPMGNLLGANGVLHETGTAWTGTLGGITFAGTRPANWNQIGPNGAMQAGTLTLTGSMVTTKTGRWWQCRVQGTTVATAGPNFTIGPAAAQIALANLSPGDKLAPYGEFEIDANGTGFAGLSLRLTSTLPNGEANVVNLGYRDTASLSWDGILSQGDYRGSWNGDLVVPIVGNEQNVMVALQPQLVASAAVDFTFRSRLIAVRKGGLI